MIVYLSRTGNVKNVVDRLELPNIELFKGLLMDKEFVLITYTDKLGEVPEQVEIFLEDNYNLLKGVIVSGSHNFGHTNYCRAGDIISEKYNVPLIRKLDLRGTESDLINIKKEYNRLIGGI